MPEIDYGSAAPEPTINYGEHSLAPEEQESQGGFLSHLGHTLASVPAGIFHAVTNPSEFHPLDALRSWQDQSQALHDKAVEAAQSGNYTEAAVHGVNFLANLIPGLGQAMDEAAMAKSPEEFKAKLGDVVGTALLAKAPQAIPKVVKAGINATGLIPSATRAGTKFSQVAAAIYNTPVDVSVPAQIATDTVNVGGLGKTGSTVPKVITDLARRAKTTTDLPFEESRNFQTSAGRLSTAEKLATNPQMQRQVSLLAKSLAESNEAAANAAGVGDLYRDAISEYRRAMKIQDFKDATGELAKKYAIHALEYAGYGAAAGAGYEAYKAYTK